jgi:hypothetical protein
MTADPDLEFVRDRVRAASRRTRHPEARADLRRALAELTDHYGEPVAECPDCHMLMLARRLAETDCPQHAF